MNCDYCNEEIPEENYEKHLAKEHELDELSSIDERRAKNYQEDNLTVNDIKQYATPLLIIGGIVGVLAVTFMILGGNSTTPKQSQYDVKQMPGDTPVHYHGQMDVIITGNQLDFSQPKYQLQATAFHFESGNGEKWHAHRTGVTIEYALATLGIESTQHSLTYDGTTYQDSSPKYEVKYLVDGEPVNPQTYVLQKGDHVVVKVVKK